MMPEKEQVMRLTVLYSHFYCYYILKYILNRIHKSKKINNYW